MTASNRTRRTGSLRWTYLVTCAAIAVAAGFLYQARLALVSDGRITADIRHRVGSARGIEQVRAALAAHYRVMGTWTGPALPLTGRGKPEPDGPGVQVLIGEYRGIPFIVSVDALVWLDKAGAIQEVRVRRHMDAF